jgi:hypothetical protein
MYRFLFGAGDQLGKIVFQTQSSHSLLEVTWG